MEEDGKTISINPDDLVARLRQVESIAEGDIARVIELLLVENHVLKRRQSTGLSRGVGVRFDTYPRFLRFDTGANADPEQDKSSAKGVERP
ncbi:hypothetical protein [uncultured Tateyamaria sp.]|uniref:hypothetical protein n=1 Tax=uncultured Tateyamaria sp. TaxID=455651 RepID=UPI002633938D|nr:hypothetical protein [uncultured Tateyamaria sp.]